jgi:hypothetical protein
VKGNIRNNLKCHKTKNVVPIHHVQGKWRIFDKKTNLKVLEVMSCNLTRSLRLSRIPTKSGTVSVAHLSLRF